MTPDEQIARAHRARAILDDPLVVEAFEALEREAFQAWRNSTALDTDKREVVHAEMRALAAFKQKLQVIMAAGSVATFDRNMLDRKSSNG